MKPPKLNKVCTTSIDDNPASDVQFLKRYFSKIELVRTLDKSLRICRYLMSKFRLASHLESNHRLSPTSIHGYRSAFLLFYYIISSTEFTVDFFEPVFTYTYKVIFYKRLYTIFRQGFLALHPPLHLLHIIVKKKVIAICKELTTLVIIHHSNIHSSIIIAMINDLVLA